MVCPSVRTVHAVKALGGMGCHVGGGPVAHWSGHWICNQEVTSLTRGCFAIKTQLWATCSHPCTTRRCNAPTWGPPTN